VDHAQLGARLLARWGLPENIVAAVRHHHHLPGAEPFQHLAATIHLADALAYRIGDEPANDPLHVSAYAMILLNFKHDDVGRLVQEIRKEMKRAPELMAA
jgi:HD-like signal output (HDOD) protein